MMEMTGVLISSRTTEGKFGNVINFLDQLTLSKVVVGVINFLMFFFMS